MKPEPGLRKRTPTPIILIHVLAYIGVAFWLSMIVTAVTTASDTAMVVVVIGVVLGSAHVGISVFTTRHSSVAIKAMLFVFVSDSFLAIFVDYRAAVLVLFTVVLIALTRTGAGKEWFNPAE